VGISCIHICSVCNYVYVPWNFSDLKWLIIVSVPSFTYNRPQENEDSMFITDAVFVKVFSLMHLEYLSFDVANAKVNTRLYYYDRTLSFITIVLEYYIHHCNSVFLFDCWIQAVDVEGLCCAVGRTFRQLHTRVSLLRE
jgi:hypothetical protein